VRDDKRSDPAHYDIHATHDDGTSVHPRAITASRDIGAFERYASSTRGTIPA
jgi:hypothetical protein